MVEFELKVNEKQNTIYVPKWMREAWGHNLKIRPNLISGILYPSNVPLEDVLKSLKVITLDLEHDIERRVETQ